MMNLTLDGMLPEDVTTEAHQAFWRSLRFSENFRETFPFGERVVTLPLANPLEGSIAGRLSWVLPANEFWSVEPRRVSVELAPGGRKEVTFKVGFTGELADYLPLPSLRTHFHGEDDAFHLERTIYLPLDLTAHAKQYPAVAASAGLPSAPVIDGKLDEPCWQEAPSIERLVPRNADGYAPVGTQVWIRHDEDLLYLAARCEEPWLRDLLTEVRETDGEVRSDDSLEFLFDSNWDKSSYFHLVVNAAGTLYDGRKDDASWSSQAKVATGREENAWTVELAVPLDALEADLGSAPVWGLQVARHRPRLDTSKSYQWAPTFWYGNQVPSLFGQLKFR